MTHRSIRLILFFAFLYLIPSTVLAASRGEIISISPGINQRITINGKVLDLTTNKPLPNAGVILKVRDNFSGKETIYSATTNKKGDYSFIISNKLFLSITCQMVVSSNGYEKAVFSFRPSIGKIYRINFYLFDIEAPIGNIKINNNAEYTNTRNVTLYLTAYDGGSGINKMSLSNNRSQWTLPEAFMLTKQWQLLDGDGIKKVYVKFSDKAGNWSVVYGDDIMLDTIPPRNPSVSIDQGEYTRNSTIALNLSAEGAYQMIISENSYFNGAQWINYNTAKKIILTSGDGRKTVYVKYRDQAGNETQIVNDSIILDTTPPQIEITSPENNYLTNQTAVNISGIYTEQNLSAITVNGIIAEVEGNNFTVIDVPLSNEGDNSITVQITDLAGNQSTQQINIIKDTIPPQNPTILINEGEYTNNQTINLTLSAEGAVEMMISEDPGFNGAEWEDYTTAKEFTITAGDGLKTVYVKYRDEVQNETASVNGRIILDQTLPQITITNPEDGFVTTQTQIAVSGTFIENHLNTITVNGIIAEINNSTFTVANVPLQEGQNIIIAQATDLANNVFSYSIAIYYKPVIEISGHLTGNITWTSNYIYLLIGNTYLDSGSKLIIMPGTTIKVNGYYFFQINGTLISEGSESQMITFTSNGGIPAKNDWVGIRGSGAEGLTVRHCIIEYGCIGLDAVSSTSPVIEDNVISHHGNIGINLTGNNIEELICIRNEVYDNNIGIKYLAAYGLQGGVVSFIRNTIYGNIGDGIYISTFPNALANVTIRGNNIYNNGSNGVECYASYDGRISKINLVISNNEIHNNSGSGIYSERGDSFCSVGATIIHNSIYCNNAYGIYCCDRGVSIVNYNNLFNNVNYDLYNRNPLAIDGRYNWWGEAVTAEMDAGGNPKNISKIYDYHDNPVRGVVDYSSYVNESSVEINLLHGFNLISIPIVPADLKPSSVFHEITNLTGNLYKWNPQSQDWIVYNGSDEEFRNIEIGKAYRVYVDTPITLHVRGGANIWDWQELFHYTGRNLFGVPFVSNTLLYLCTVENTVTGEVLNISNAVQSGWIGNNLEWWDAATQTSQFIDLTGDLTGTMLTGSTGYWIDINLPNLILTLPSDSPVISDISIVPNPFSPDEDFINDTTAIIMVLEKPGFSRINIYNQDHEFIKDIDLQRKDGSENTYESVWDGRDYTGTYIKNGIYTAYFDTGSILRRKERAITVNNYPLITDFSVLPNPFSPDGDGQNETTTITFNLSEDSLLSVKVYNLSQELVRTIAEDLAVSAGDQTFIWDGLDGQGGELIAGRYVVNISAQSIFGGEINSVNLNAYVAFISKVLTPTDLFNPGGGESCFMNYTLARDAIISIDLYNSEDNLVRNLVAKEPRMMGTFSEVWDGRDNNGDIVPDGVYYFIITDSISGEPSIAYDPRGTGGQDISHSISLSVTTFNPARNIPCVLSYNTPQTVEIIIKVRNNRYGGAAIKVIEYHAPKPQGQGISVWDGRDELGQLIHFNNYTFAIWGYTLIDNAIIVAGKVPIIGNNITVEPISFSPKGSPYSEINSITLTYSLSRNCDITVKIYDSNNNLIRTLLTAVSRNEGINNEVWDGRNNNGLLVPEDEYRIDIQGENEGNYSVVRSATVFVHY